MKRKRYPALLAACAGILWGAGVGADGDIDLKFASVPSMHLQLRPFMAPIKSLGPSVAPITVFLEPADPKDLGTICHYVPRIMDAMLRELSRRPIAVKRRKLVVEDLPDRLLGPINGVLEKKLVASVYVEPGAVGMNAGSAQRLPFTAGGCKEVRDLAGKNGRAE